MRRLHDGKRRLIVSLFYKHLANLTVRHLDDVDALNGYAHLLTVDVVACGNSSVAVSVNAIDGCRLNTLEADDNLLVEVACGILYYTCRNDNGVFFVVLNLERTSESVVVSTPYSELVVVCTANISVPCVVRLDLSAANECTIVKIYGR